jgi:hypothetical protein
LKKWPNFSKSSPNSLQAKKSSDINIKAHFESPKHLKQTSFETAKNGPIFQKVALTVSKPKHHQISTTKLILKVQNIYTKQTSFNIYSKPNFETANFGENVVGSFA